MVASRAFFWTGMAVCALLVGAPLGVWYAAAHPELVFFGEKVPETPVPVAPADGVATGLDPTFTWTGDSLGGWFLIDFSSEPTFPRGLSERHIDITQNWYQREEAFAPGIRMYWRLMAVSEDLEISEFSEVRSFVPTPGLTE